jgi:hypothetical protein
VARIRPTLIEFIAIVVGAGAIKATSKLHGNVVIGKGNTFD